MIKINKLIKVWESAGYDEEAVIVESKKLYYGIQALFENAMITREKRDVEHAKLEVAASKALKRLKKANKQTCIV